MVVFALASLAMYRNERCVFNSESLNQWTIMNTINKDQMANGGQPRILWTSQETIWQRVNYEIRQRGRAYFEMCIWVLIWNTTSSCVCSGELSGVTAKPFLNKHNYFITQFRFSLLSPITNTIRKHFDVQIIYFIYLKLNKYVIKYINTLNVNFIYKVFPR